MVIRHVHPIAYAVNRQVPLCTIEEFKDTIRGTSWRAAVVGSTSLPTDGSEAEIESVRIVSRKGL